MKWTDEKLNILKDEYSYVSNEELATKLGCSVSALVKKASRINIKKATNNSIIDGQKYCTLCKAYHNIDNFYKDKYANEGYQYYCKLYYKSHNPRETTTPPNIKSHNPREGIGSKCHNPRESREFSLDWKRNPIIVVNGQNCLRCKCCQEIKPLYNFYENKNMVSGRVNKCKKCYNKSSKKDK